jgi:adenylate cyclase
VLSIGPAAHEAFLKGNFYWNRLTCEGLEKGLASFQKAAELEPEFAPAQQGIADTYYTLVDWGCWPSKPETISKMRSAVNRALELDPNLADSYVLLGEIAYRQDFNWAQAEKQYLKALALDPAADRSQYAIFLVSMGRKEQGLAEMEKALRLDPTSEVKNMASTYLFYLAHEFDKAIAQGRKTLELYPRSAATYQWIGESYEAQGMYAEAMDAYLKAKAYGGGRPEEVAGLQSAYAKGGISAYYRKILDSPKAKELGPCWTLLFGRHLRDKQLTLELLDWSTQNRCQGLQTMKVDPAYDHVRDDPRFQQLLGRLQL